MRVTAFIHDPSVIREILQHRHRYDPPRGPPFDEPVHERTVEYEPFADIHDHDAYN